MGGDCHKAYARPLWQLVETEVQAEFHLLEENEKLSQQLAEEKALRVKIAQEEIPKLEEELAQAKKETWAEMKELLEEARKIAKEDKQGQNRILRARNSRSVIFDNMTEDEIKNALDFLKARGLVDKVEEEDCGQPTAKLLADVKEDRARAKPEPMDDEQLKRVVEMVDCELQDRNRMLLKELNDERAARLKLQRINADLEDVKIVKDAKIGDLDFYMKMLLYLLLLLFIAGAVCFWLI